MRKRIGGISKSILEQLYVQDGKTTAQIGQILGCSKHNVGYWLKKHGISPRHNTKPHQLIGARFGALTVESKCESKVTLNQGQFWLCRCDCGQITTVRTQSLVSGSTRSCGSRKHHSVPKDNHDLDLAYWSRLKQNANHRGLEFTITRDYAVSIFTNQCALSGVYISLDNSDRRQNASIDRINNSLGYIPGNIQWVHKDINRMRGGLSVEDFAFWCRRVTQYTKENLSS